MRGEISLAPKPMRRGSRRLSHRALLLAASAAVWALIVASSAQAATVTVGSPLTGSFTSTSSGGGPATWANTALSDPGANVTSPINGTLVRWRVTGAFSGGPFRLRVLRPSGGGTYTGAGTSAPQTPSGTSTQAFTTNLPIQAGDLIGLDPANTTDTIGTNPSSDPGNIVSVWSPQLVDGGAARPAGGTFNPGNQLGFNADVQPPPGISSINPASGSIAGGSSVVISGHDFSGASAMKFGFTAASSFTVNSDTQITAIAPPSSTPGVVDTSVTTAAGTTAAAAADQFTYTACVVPKLKGKKLKADKKKLKKADCRLGKVKGPKGKSAKVKKQKPKPGSVLPAGSKVNVKLG